MEKTVTANNQKIKRFDYFTDQFISKSLDFIWYSNQNEEELFKEGKTNDLERFKLIESQYLEVMKYFNQKSDGDNWKGFYAGILACARCLKEAIKPDGKYNFPERDCCNSHITYPLFFKMEYAEEACSLKEHKRWYYGMCPPAFVSYEVTEIVDGEEVKTRKYKVADYEPEVILDEDGELVFK